MADRLLVRQLLRRWRRGAAASSFINSGTDKQQYYYATATCEKEKNCNQWLILPPFTPAADGVSIGKKLHGLQADANMTAIKWILKCCPHLPRSLVQKLFRLRQIRKEGSNTESKEQRPKRIGAKDLMGVGEKIFLPKSVDGNLPSKTLENQSLFNEKESELVRSLELYKDPAIIVINKPPGMPVQGGLGIKTSLDELAAKYLRYDYSESPRLVHRLDRDSSGILVMGRTQLSATILHSIFREKTFGASNDVPGSDKTLQKKYYALVIGSPRRREGLISVPLMKVVVDNGKSERITVVDNSHTLSVQHSVTEYRVIASSSCGYTWLELSPLTGRKHQLRVHCAEVLGTPIVGDYKYGWQAHRKLGQFMDSASTELESGSVSDKQPFLHLHCKEMILPDISLVLQRGGIVSDLITAQAETIKLDAPLPVHMQRSWDLLN
ncbi:rna pseudouridine synthase 4 mitochondrial [Phtheirospermum japonicum]|uniref:Rna pseudouridine synthase 4 mitochondrial n=1 Tax=Phtheirospermum japonicum TaxID=374723 RepID=A0A830CD35_9LAMI|nr:rna pseudouridine synthase 4 mitochondrial [Phtheirospermum japonicum]